jgi:uncharacterized protein YodC (DUF2158 family)
MADKFVQGDLVQLKSGGPPMTVNECPSDINEYNGRPKGIYNCVWFKGATKESGNFDEHLLQAFVKPK